MRFRILCLVFVTTALVAIAQSPTQPVTKRPLKHSDYEIWNTTSSMTLSDDGKWLAYNQLPGEGDGVVVVKSLTGATEYRFPRGGRPSFTPPTPGAPPTATPPPPTTPNPTTPAPTTENTSSGGGVSGSPQFTPDGKRVLFPLTPTKAELDKARTDRAEAPKSVLVVVDLSNGKIVERLSNLKSYTVVSKTNYLLLFKEAKREEPTAAASVLGGFAFTQQSTPSTSPTTGVPTFPSGGTPRTFPRRGGVGGRPATTSPSPTRRTVGTDLVIRNLVDGKERTLSEVDSFTITRDGKSIVCTVASRNDDGTGVYFFDLGGANGPTVLKAGRGRYSRVILDEKQTRIAFAFDDLPAVGSTAKVEPKPRVFLWNRDSKSAAKELLGPTTNGLKSGYMLATNTMRFTQDGLKLALEVAPMPTEKPKAEEPLTTPEPTPTTGATSPDRVDLDLWHWKDELIQPMQRVRREVETRNFTAVYFFDTNTFRQISDETLTVPVPDHGDWSTASNDKPYRYLTGYGAQLADYTLVNVRSGEKKPLLKAHEGFVTTSPKGTYRLSFDGKNWLIAKSSEGVWQNLTAKMTVKLTDEEHDEPRPAPSYGTSGWTADERFVFIHDRFDIWKVAADGSTIENLTKIGRELKTRLRLVQFPDADGESPRAVDLSKPLLLQATNLQTFDTGFYSLTAGAKPKLLMMGARSYGTPVKATRADTLLVRVRTFYDGEDYYATDSSFHNVRKVTDINPRKNEFNWGKAELVSYKSLDGVDLSGVLIKPENFDSSKKYPMIVYIYERLSDTIHTFRPPSAGTSINPTYYASNGYLVFMPDITYTVGSPGQSALKCVLPGIQSVIDKGYVNENAIGIQGHSWGGYQIAYMVTQTNRFKAAASGAPVSNMVSAYGGIRWTTGLPREFQYERTQSRIGATLWQAPMKFIENSPIFMADRVTTPLMILHNDQDGAVPWYQGIEYYLALRRLGKECYLFNYNGEDHGLRRKSAQRDYTVRMQQFFDHHLKGAPMPDWMKNGIPYSEREKEKESLKKLFRSDD